MGAALYLSAINDPDFVVVFTVFKLASVACVTEETVAVDGIA
jgi:hypothetical protein